MKSEIRTQLWTLSRLRTYFLRGHSNWFAYGMSFLNFITISFYLLIENLTIVPNSFRFRDYALLFFMTYIPLAIIVGYVDMKKGTYRVEQKMAMEMSPIWTEVFEKLESLTTNQSSLHQLITELKDHDK